MDSKPLLFGLTGFFLGGLIVSIAATTFAKDELMATSNKNVHSNMMIDLKSMTGDEYDKVFLSEMIKHHEGALQMAQLSAANAKHSQLKQLSSEIIADQEREIAQMKRWQQEWGYNDSNVEDGSVMDHPTH